MKDCDCLPGSRDGVEGRAGEERDCKNESYQSQFRGKQGGKNCQNLPQVNLPQVGAANTVGKWGAVAGSSSSFHNDISCVLGNKCKSVSHPAASKDIIGNAHKIAIIGLKFHRVSLLSKSLNTMGPVVAPQAQTAKQAGRLIGGAHS